ncbi:MAG: energy transducer TonB [Acidobacteriota bacterium]
MAVLVIGSAHDIDAQSPGESVDAKLISMPQADYPKVALDAFVGGKVNIRVNIDAQGRVTNAAVAFGPDWVCPNVSTPAVVALREAALAVALQAKFSPAMVGSVPTSSVSIVTVEFKAERAPAIAGLAATNVMQADTSDTTAKVATSVSTTDGVGPLPATDRPKIISGGVLNGKALTLPTPAYPAAAKAVSASGTVSVQVLIYEDGTVYSAKAVSGHPLLRQASEVAACSSTFSSTLLQGSPVKVSGVITYNFNL